MKRSYRFITIIITLAIVGILLYAGFRQLQKAIYPLKYASIVEKYADENSVSRSLIFAVIKCESSFKADATSSIGAKGLMQITPETFDWAQTKSFPNLKLSAENLTDPETNIKFGSLLLSLHLNEFQDTKTALAAYHAGRSKVNSWLNNTDYSIDGKTLFLIPFDDTRNYVNRVIATEKTYTNLYKEEFKNER